MLEFKDYATALACYNSPEYQAAIKLRTPHSVGDIVIVEGYDGPQPAADIVASRRYTRRRKPERHHARHAADRGRRRRAHGAHAGQGDRRDAGLMLAGATEGEGSPLLGQDSGVLAGLPPNRVIVTSEVRPLTLAADAIIDFTVPAATVQLAALAAETHLAHIIGTTGMSAADDAKIAEAAKKTAIMKSGNMSLGVNLLAVMTRQVAQALDEEFDIEIVEMHHNKKIDAPSGTALLLGEAAAAGRKIDLDDALGARARRPYRRAQGRRHRLCDAARRHRRGRASA